MSISPADHSTPTGKTSVEGGSESIDRVHESPDKAIEAADAPRSDTEKALAPNEQHIEAPDGGVTAWLVIFGCWCAGFSSFAIGVFQQYYQSVLFGGRYSASTVSWIPSLQVFFLLALGPFVGAYFDRNGPRLLLLVGTFLHVLGIMMASLGTQYYHIILAQGVCSAIGTACVFQPSVTCAAGWFNKGRGTAFGVMFTGSSLGGIVFPIMVSRLISQLGFPWAMRTCGFLVLVLLVIANLTVRTFAKPRPKAVTVAQLVKPLKEMDFVLYTAGSFLFSYGFFIPANMLPLQAVSVGIPTSLAQYLVAIFNAGALVGRIMGGMLADRIGRYNLFLVVSYLSGVWVLALWLPTSSQASIIAFAVLFGSFSGVFVSLITPMVLDISPFSELGFRVGMVQFAIAISGLTANPLAGAILDSPSGWTGAKIFAGVLCIAGTACVHVVRVRRAGWKMTARY